MPRRAQHAAGTGLAFSRCANQQLWVCYLEKAYAKAHGSYQAISGGQIAEVRGDAENTSHSKRFGAISFGILKLSFGYVMTTHPFRTILKEQLQALKLTPTAHFD